MSSDFVSNEEGRLHKWLQVTIQMQVCGAVLYSVIEACIDCMKQEMNGGGKNQMPVPNVEK